MYKTIRQGENSLQYTILPQQDEGRSGPSVGHRSGGGQRTGGNRKKSILAYIGLFFVCAIITFAILIPLMVTSDLMPTPTAWFYRSQKVRDFRNPVNVKMSVDVRPENHIIKGTPLRTTITSTSTTTSTTTEKPNTKSPEHTSPLWSDELSVTEFQNLYKSDESMEQAMGMPKEFIAKTTTTIRAPTTVPPGSLNLFLSRARQRIIPTTHMAPSTTRQSPPSARNYPKHFSLQKHEKPEEPPKAIQVDTNTEDMAQVHQNWLQSHWSYVDPYLQWRVSGFGAKRLSYWNLTFFPLFVILSRTTPQMIESFCR